MKDEKFLGLWSKHEVLDNVVPFALISDQLSSGSAEMLEKQV